MGCDRCVAGFIETEVWVREYQSWRLGFCRCRAGRLARGRFLMRLSIELERNDHRRMPVTSETVSTSRGLPPWAVALLRGALEAAVLAGIGVLITALGDVTTGDLAPWAPLGLLGLRQLEGLADQHIDPTRQRAVGGAPVSDRS